MKHKFSVLLIVLMLFLTGCGKPAAEQTPPVDDEPPSSGDSIVSDDQSTAQAAPNYFQMSICDETGTCKELTAFDNGQGGIAVEYAGKVRKTTTLALSVMEQLVAELEKTSLATLNGQSVYEKGLSCCSMYVSYPNDNFLGCNFNGSIPEEFMAGFEAMDTWFQTLLADVPEYGPILMGEVPQLALREMTAILETSDLHPLDSYVVSRVTKDELFTPTIGLHSDIRIHSVTSCSSLMSPTDFSCAIMVLEEGANVEDISVYLACNVDWWNWVCVSGDSALLARKDNMVLCLLGSGPLYQATFEAIEDNGWIILNIAKTY